MTLAIDRANTVAKAKLDCLFGRIPENSDNLEIVGAIKHEVKDLRWPAIWGESGLVVAADGSLLTDCIWRRDMLERCPQYLVSKRRFFPRIKFGTYFNTMLYWCRGYYHWICDVLPRIQRALPHLPPETRFIVPSGLDEPYMDALAAVGVTRQRCEVFRGSRPWRVRRLIHVPPVAMTGDHTQASLLGLRESVLSHVGTGAEGHAPKRIYVSRRSGLERVLRNEEEVVRLLGEFGFERVYCEDSTFAQQVEMFRQAEFVVGPHGGGLTNTVWCERGTKVLEIFHPQSVRRCYWSIAQSIGLVHYCGVAEDSAETGHHGMHVDIAQLRRAIGDLVG